MTTFTRNDRVFITKNGTTVEGTIVSGREPFYPDSTVTKYGSGSQGRRAWGYKVRSPIVLKDGSIYMVRGRPADGIGWVEEQDIRL